MSEPTSDAPRPAWPDYRAVWRWHFYASLFCMPFVVVLSLSGAVYLFKPQIEAWLDYPYDQLDVAGTSASAAKQVQAALDAVPGAVVAGYELPATERSAIRVIVRQNGEALRVYVHPETLAVLFQQAEEDRPMRWLFKLHGELLMGDRGSNLVELAASWTVVMLLTGLYLWWPRGSRRWAGVLYPRWRAGSRVWWRDLHSVTGIWIAGLALFLLATGLPWAKFWGSYFKLARRVTGTAVAQQDWTTGSERSSGGHGDHGANRQDATHPASGTVVAPPLDLTSFDRVVATVRPLRLEPPVVISPPAQGGGRWSAKSLTANRPRRVNLVVDGATGEIVRREDFRDRHMVDRVIGVGIAAHEGQLFGWPNQLLGLFTAAGLMTLSASGVVMWWRRRDQGTLGAPPPLGRPQWSWALVAAIGLLAVYLPLFGGSAVVVLLIERLILKRIPAVRDWLGLHPPATVAVS